MGLVRPTVTETTTSAAVVEQQEELTTAGVTATAEVEAPAAAAAATVAADPVVETQAAMQEAGVAKTAVAVAQPTQVASVTEQRVSAMQQFSADQAAAGYEGLDLTGMSFDRIKMHEGKFLLGSDEKDLGTSFECVIHSTRRLFVVRQDESNDADSFYSYDPKGLAFTDGSPSEEKLAEWQDEGYGVEGNPLDIREYLEAMATLVNRTDEHEQTMVTLSIPPASKARLAGVAAQAFQKFQKATLGDVVTQCTVGNKVGEGNKAFRPWVFKVTTRYQG